MPAPRGKVRSDTGLIREQLGPGRQVVALDFETYFDDEYTLRKLSTSEYIRDPRFEVLSVAIKIGDGPVEFHGGPAAVKAALKKIDWASSSLLCHHAHFDGLILTHHFEHVPRYYLDTLSMGRALHAKFERNDLATLTARYDVTNKRVMPDVKGKRWKDLTPEERDAVKLYNVDDVVGMVEIYGKMVGSMPAKELDLIDLTVRMFTEPVLRLDEKLARKELRREIRERRAAIKSSGALALAREFDVEVKAKKKGDKVTDETVLASNKVFPGVLRGLGIEPPMKISKYNGKPTYALSKADEEFTDLMAHPDPRVVALVAGRLAAKSTIGETRAARLLRSGSDGKRLPVYLNYCGAHTTRWSGGDKLNYQNLKKKGEIRKALMAPKGYQLVVIDSAQIEARVLAWLAGEQWLLTAFREGRDVYCELASEIFGFVVTKADKLERFVGKTAMLGLGFQMGGPKFQTTVISQSINQGLEPVRLELAVCYKVVSTYRRKNARIEALWEFMHNTVISDLAMGPEGVVGEFKGVEYGREFVRLRGHLVLHYPEAKARVVRAPRGGFFRGDGADRTEDASYRTPMGRSKLYGGLLTENVVQYLARQVVAGQMLEIAKKYRVVMMTHDEVVFLAKTKDAPAALTWGLDVMKTPPAWAPDLPVNAEGGFDSVYSK